MELGSFGFISYGINSHCPNMAVGTRSQLTDVALVSIAMQMWEKRQLSEQRTRKQNESHSVAHISKFTRGPQACIVTSVVG